MLLPRLLLVVPLALTGVVLSLLPDRMDEEQRLRERRKAHRPRMDYLDNGTLKIGVDLNLGGAITYLSPAKKELNLVNSWDWGRQIQMSYYSGPARYRVGNRPVAKVWEHFPWNPVQAGDHFGNPSKVLKHSNDGKELYIQCRPMQWSLDNAPSECTFESWIRLEGSTVRVRSRLSNARADRTQYPAHDQEMPAVYVNGPYHRLMTCTSEKPFSDAPLERIEGPAKPEGTFPWARFQATECWAALVNDDGWGLGVWQPGCQRFLGGFAGKPGKGGPEDGPTGYLAPVRREILDHNIRHEYEYVLIVGKLDDIRAHVVRHSPKPAPPRHQFREDRQGWTYHNATDSGWPIRGELRVRLEKDDPQLLGPIGFWRAEEAPTLRLEAAFRTTEKEAQLYWATLKNPSFAEERSVRFPIRGDGEWRTYAVKLADSRAYQGVITQLRLDPVAKGSPGAELRLRSVQLGR